jgi:hypothetical protein
MIFKQVMEQPNILESFKDSFFSHSFASYDYQINGTLTSNFAT